MNIIQYLYLLGPVGVRGIAKHAQMTHNEIWYELDAMLTMRIAREVREGQFELTEDGLLVLERMHPREDDDQVEAPVRRGRGGMRRGRRAGGPPMNKSERTRVLKALGDREHSANSIRESMLRHYSFDVVRAKLESLVTSGHATRREQKHNRGVVVFYRATERRDARKLEKAAFVPKPRPKDVQETKALEAMIVRSSLRLEIINRKVPFREMPARLRSRALTRAFERGESEKFTAEANWR